MKNKYILYSIIAVLVVLALVFLWRVKSAGADDTKGLNAECEINDSEHPCDDGLVCTPFNGENSKCEYPEMTETPEVTATPTPEPTETPAQDFCETLDGIQAEDEDCPEPTPTPTETPEPTATPSATPTEAPRLSEASAPQAPACEAPIYAPTVTFTGRKDADTVSFSWTTVKDGLHTYIVWYGTSKDNLPWNAIVNGESTDLNEVPDTHIWAKVAGYDNGCVGKFSETVDP